MIYAILTIIKALLILIGAPLTIINVIPGIKGDQAKLKKARIMFFSVFLSVVFITVIEFTLMIK